MVKNAHRVESAAIQGIQVHALQAPGPGPISLAQGVQIAKRAFESGFRAKSAAPEPLAIALNCSGATQTFAAVQMLAFEAMLATQSKLVSDDVPDQ